MLTNTINILDTARQTTTFEQSQKSELSSGTMHQLLDSWDRKIFVTCGLLNFGWKVFQLSD